MNDNVMIHGIKIVTDQGNRKEGGGNKQLMWKVEKHQLL